MNESTTPSKLARGTLPAIRTVLYFLAADRNTSVTSFLLHNEDTVARWFKIWCDGVRVAYIILDPADTVQLCDRDLGLSTGCQIEGQAEVDLAINYIISGTLSQFATFSVP